jgi:hypothetical protein
VLFFQGNSAFSQTTMVSGMANHSMQAGQANLIDIDSLLGLSSINNTSGLGNQINIGIRFFDKKIYYLKNSPVYVEFSIVNNSPDVYRFKFADDRFFSVDFSVMEPSSRVVEYSDLVLRRRNSSVSVFFRELTLESGESFSFVENLRDYINIDTTGSYIVQAKFYPELLRGYISHCASVDSNKLSLLIRPNGISALDGDVMSGMGTSTIPLDEETNANLFRAKLPPDEVVSYMLGARQKAQWEKFFLYLDLEALLLRDAANNRRWRAESEEGRMRMLARYRDELKNAVADGDISMVPMDFEIERTTYNATEGTVIVLERFKTGAYIEKKRYTYYLSVLNGVWTIVDFVVVNIGLE